jgi:glycosyltransferase 2 family protein
VTPRAWACVRLAGAAAVLAVLVDRVGTGPFLAGLRSVSIWSLAAASGIAVLTTACCAWRWCTVARGLGVPLRIGTAFLAYYRSQFLNGALPGGILGDIHRGVRHGRDAGDLGRGLRAVAWERTAGQAVQLLIAVLVLSIAPSPVRATMPVVLIAIAACAGVVVWAVRATPGDGSSAWARAVRTAVTELRDGLAARRQSPVVVGTSVVSVMGHTATFVIAARVAGSTTPIAALLPLTMLVLLAAAAPMNVGGWGPREGVAAWAFASAGLGASQGVAAGTAYGVLVAAASLPGAVVLVVGLLGRRSRPTGPVGSLPRPPLERQGSDVTATFVVSAQST